MKHLKYFSLVLIATLILTGCGKKEETKKPEDIIKEYCSILENGNYSDIYDIVYLPESPLINDKTIEEAKKVYDTNMKANNKITSCTYTESGKKQNFITYKVVYNDKDIVNLDVDINNNKIMLDDFYLTINYKLDDYTTLYVDDVKIEKKSNANEEYNTTINVLKGAKYKFVYKHPFFNDTISNIDWDKTKISSGTYENTIKGYYDNLGEKENTNINSTDIELLKTMFKEITIAGFEQKSIDSVKKYFEKDSLYSYLDLFTENSTYAYKSFNSLYINELKYIGDNEIIGQFSVYYNASNKKTNADTMSGTGGKVIKLKKRNDYWVITEIHENDYEY